MTEFPKCTGMNPGLDGLGGSHHSATSLDKLHGFRLDGFCFFCSRCHGVYYLSLSITIGISIHCGIVNQAHFLKDEFHL